MSDQFYKANAIDDGGPKFGPSRFAALTLNAAERLLLEVQRNADLQRLVCRRKRNAMAVRLLTPHDLPLYEDDVRETPEGFIRLTDTVLRGHTPIEAELVPRTFGNEVLCLKVSGECAGLVLVRDFDRDLSRLCQLWATGKKTEPPATFPDILEELNRKYAPKLPLVPAA